MQAPKHPEYSTEKEKLNEMCRKIDGEITMLEERVNYYEKKTEGIRKTSNGGFVTEFEMASHMFEIHSKKLLEYKRSYDKPYFGRIDFQKLDSKEKESFYIGKTSLLNKEDKKMLIIDWRAPISGIYYSGELGEAMYRSPDGLVIGELSLKRQYEIQDRKLINIFDKGLTPMDEFLQKALWEKKDNRLKDIVMTIQSEQNDIIRAERNKVIIVQGAAGSGKTTIVLHRIAYLMYTYKDSLKPEKILTLVPNKLFLNYISDVLPDLGIEEITQLTFEELSIKIIGKRIKLIDKEEKIVKLLDKTPENSTYRKNLIKVSSFKGSILLKSIIDDYINELEKKIIPKDRGISIEGYEIYSANELNKLFYKNYSYVPLIKRVKRLRGYVKGTNKERINKIIKELERRKSQSMDQLIEKRDFLDDINENINNSINSYFKSLTKIDIENVYKEIMTNKDLISKYICDDLTYSDTVFITEYCKSIFDNKIYEPEDLALLTYLKIKLFGINDNYKYNHIVVDEAQDYNSIQMLILKELSENNSFTIVGDLSQGIYSYSGTEDWNDFIENVFGKLNTEFLKIKKCYRSTKEIMEFANKIISNSKNKNLISAEPVLRSGDKPVVIECKSENIMISKILHKILNLKNEGLKSIAIICKTGEESKKIYNQLVELIGDDIQLISNNDTEYNGGIVVIPIYMAKGLEFDGVIIYNCTEESYSKDELDIKLLYVAATRALHKLILYHCGCKSSLLL